MPRLRLPLLALALPLLAHATQPQHAVWQSYADLSAGKCRSVSLTEDGVLAAAPAIGNLADLGVEEAWSVLALPDGSVIVGTAPEGKLLKVGPDGTVSELAKFDESHLYALAAGPRGEIYVGASPDGKVYRVGLDGKTEVYFDPKEKYIWALAVAPDGTLYVGTGTRGRIYRVAPNGDGQLWYASNETHIRSLAVDQSGALLAGSAESGYLYRITGRDQAAVVAATGREEVNQICVRPDGTICFTATGTAKDSATAAPLKKAVGSDAAPADKDASVSSLYQLTAALEPELLWSTRDTILSCVGSGDDGALVGTGADGYTYAVSPHGEATRLGKIDSDSVTALARIGDDTILATSNPGRLFRIGRQKSQPGLFETDVVDSGSFARWGAVTVDASDPGGVKIMTRSGNTAEPDKTWYPWTEAIGGRTASPAARYLQVQLQIASGTVDRIDACFLPKNLPPHLDTVKILPVGLGYTPAPQSPLPPSPVTAAQLLTGGDAADPKPSMHWQAENAHGLRTLVWKATDPNGDALTYAVSWRKQGETAWHDLARDLTENLLTWDTSSWSDGKYELKVEASDAAANPPGEGLTDSVVSRAIVVDNAPPVIQVISRQAGTVEFTVNDSLSPLLSVTTSTDGKDYAPIVPVDGILDSGSERFLAKVPPGQILFIRAEDAGGNIAGAQAAK